MHNSIPVIVALLLGATQASALFMAEDPVISIEEDGRATLSWRTEQPSPPARVALGIEMSDDPFRDPRYRISVSEDADSSLCDHRISFGLRWLERSVIDVAGFARAGGGEAVGRLEAYDPSGKRTRFFEFRFAWRHEGERWWQVPTIRLGPWIDRVGSRDAWLSWDLDSPAPVLVDLREIGEETWRSIRAAGAMQTEMRLVDLKPETRYEYRLRVGDATHPAPVWSFCTAPIRGEWPTGGTVRMAFMSDSRGGAGGGMERVRGTNRRALRALLAQAELAGADFICFGGDLIDGYTASPESYRRQLRSWKRAAECVGPRLPIYEGMGNHEILLDSFSNDQAHPGAPAAYRDKAGPLNSETLFAEAFVNPDNGPSGAAPPFIENVFSFDFGPVHIVALNNTYDVCSHPDSLGGYREGYFPDEELSWLREDLAAARARGQKEILVYAHEPAFPCGGHAADGMWWRGEKPEVLDMRSRFWGTLQDFRVRAAFFGDEHNYSRLRVDSRLGDEYLTPVWQIISGGVGAPYYARDDDVPWARQVAAFSAVQHFCLVELNDGGVSVSVIDSHGRLLEKADLD